jgi:hypothetical protein
VSYDAGVVSASWRLGELGFAFSVGHIPSVRRFARM